MARIPSNRFGEESIPFLISKGFTERAPEDGRRVFVKAGSVIYVGVKSRSTKLRYFPVETPSKSETDQPCTLMNISAGVSVGVQTPSAVDEPAQPQACAAYADFGLPS